MVILFQFYEERQVQDIPFCFQPKRNTREAFSAGAPFDCAPFDFAQGAFFVPLAESLSQRQSNCARQRKITFSKRRSEGETERSDRALQLPAENTARGVVPGLLLTSHQFFHECIEQHATPHHGLLFKKYKKGKQPEAQAVSLNL